VPSPVDTAAAPLLFAIPGRYELIERSRELAGSDALAHLERERATARAISDAYLETVVEPSCASGCARLRRARSPACWCFPWTPRRAHA